MSISGETCSPKNSASSPTFEMMVTSDGRWTASSPCRKRAAPTPPARTVITGNGKGETKNGEETHPFHISHFSFPHASFRISVLPELAREREVRHVLTQVLHGMNEGEGGRHVLRRVTGPRMRLPQRGPVDAFARRQQLQAIGGHIVEERQQRTGIVRRGAELGRAVAIRQRRPHGHAQPGART